MVLHGHRDHRSDHQYHEADTDNYVKYRSIVSSISFDNEKSNFDITGKTKWTHIGGNILRLPPIRKKFSLTNKVNIGGTNGIHSLAISPKGRYVALGLSNGEVQIRRLSIIMQNEASVCLRKPKNHSGEIHSTVTCLRFVPTMENILFCCDLSGRIDIFDTDKTCKHILSQENNEINSIDVNASGTKVISGGKDSILRVYDAATGKIITASLPVLKMNFDADPKKYHQLRIYCVKFDPENYETFYSGGLDGYVKMWDLREGLKGVRTMKGPYIRGDAMDTWGNVLLTGSWRASKGLDLWDTTSGQHLETLVPSNRASTLDAEFYECVRFFNGGRDGSVILAGGSGTGRFEVFNVVDRRMDFAVKVGNSVKSIDSTASSIVCGGLDGICRVVKYNRTEE